MTRSRKDRDRMDQDGAPAPVLLYTDSHEYRVFRTLSNTRNADGSYGDGSWLEGSYRTPVSHGAREYYVRHFARPAEPPPPPSLPASVIQRSRYWAAMFALGRQRGRLWAWLFMAMWLRGLFYPEPVFPAVAAAGLGSLSGCARLAGSSPPSRGRVRLTPPAGPPASRAARRVAHVSLP